MLPGVRAILRYPFARAMSILTAMYRNLIRGNPQSTIHDVLFRGSSSEPWQSLAGCEWLGMEAPYRGSDWFRVEDMNFDGHADIFVLTSWGATGTGCAWREVACSWPFSRHLQHS